MMKLVVLVGCVLAVASAYHEEYEHKYHGPKHYPIITKQGVPLETPEVRDAKIHHHIAHEVAAHGGHDHEEHIYHNDYHHDEHPYHRYGEGHYEHKYHGPKHYPIITKQGVPLETPAVREAKIHHHIAHEVAAHRAYDDHHDSERYYYGDIANRHGYASGYDHHGYDHHRYHGPKHYPIITKQGVPLETPEVRDAKIHHHIAHEVAAHQAHDDHELDYHHQHHHGDSLYHHGYAGGRYGYAYHLEHPQPHYRHHHYDY